MNLFEKLNNKRYDLQEAPIDNKGNITPDPGEIEKSKKIVKKYNRQQKKSEQKNIKTNTQKGDQLLKDINKRRSADLTRADAINRAYGTSGSSTEGSAGANTGTTQTKKPKITGDVVTNKGVNQADVSKQAKDFTKKINKERVVKQKNIFGGEDEVKTKKRNVGSGRPRGTRTNKTPVKGQMSLPPIDLKKPTKRIDLRTIKKRITGRKRPSNAPSLADINKKIDAKNPVEAGKPVKGSVLRVLKKGEVASKSVMQQNVPKGFERVLKKDPKAQEIIKKQVKTAQLVDPKPIKPKSSTIKPNLFGRIKNFVKGEPKIPSDYKLVRGTADQPLSVTRKVYKGKLGAVRKFVDKLPRKYKLAGTALLATAAIAPNIKNPFAPKPEKKSYTVASKKLKLDTGKKNT